MVGDGDGSLPTVARAAAAEEEFLSELSSADLFGEVESLGLELNPNLITLIVNSSVQQVKTAIAKYKTYRQLTNPEGLFYRILDNERKSYHSSLS